MLKPLIAALAVGALAGCIAIEVNEAAVTPPTPPKTCDALIYQDLIGKPEGAIDRTRLPEAHRIVCHNCPVTMDYNASRLTVALGPDGKVASARCG
jgi:hypothetical protein